MSDLPGKSSPTGRVKPLFRSPTSLPMLSQKVRRGKFEEVVLSVFFGKAVKMAQGHPYTHAHTVPLDLSPLARQAEAAGYAPAFCRQAGAGQYGS